MLSCSVSLSPRCFFLSHHHTAMNNSPKTNAITPPPWTMALRGVPAVVTCVGDADAGGKGFVGPVVGDDPERDTVSTSSS